MRSTRMTAAAIERGGSAGIHCFVVVVIFAQDLAGLDVDEVSLPAFFAEHRLVRTIFRFEIESLRNVFDDDEALNHGSGVRAAVHEGCHRRRHLAGNRRSSIGSTGRVIGGGRIIAATSLPPGYPAAASAAIWRATSDHRMPSRSGTGWIHPHWRHVRSDGSAAKFDEICSFLVWGGPEGGSQISA